MELRPELRVTEVAGARMAWRRCLSRVPVFLRCLSRPEVIELRGRNPTWVRDELIVALDMYLRHAGNRSGAGSVEIAEPERRVEPSRALHRVIVTMPDHELAAARRADLMHAALWAAVWAFGPSSIAATSMGEPSGNGSDGLSLSCTPRRPPRNNDAAQRFCF